MNEGDIKTAAPIVFVLIGVPGSGRTYTAKKLAEVFNGFHLQADEFRAELFDAPERFSQQDNIVNRMTLLLLDKLFGMRMNIVLDGDSNRRSFRQQLRRLAKENGYEILTVWVQTDVDTAYSRCNKRDRRLTEEKYAIEYTSDMYDQELARFQSPQFEKFVVISGKHAFRTQFYAIRRKMIELEYMNKPVSRRLQPLSKTAPKTNRSTQARRRLKI